MSIFSVYSPKHFKKEMLTNEFKVGSSGSSSVIHDATLTGDGSVMSPLGLPYKIYTAFGNQSGTNAPVPDIFANTIGTIVYT